tara:strand:+ start:1333 stop:1596 length:264 start_codon:yes stop_codon:yes gene_type:complete
MDKNKIQLESLKFIQENGILDAFINIYSSKLGISEIDAKKVLDQKISMKLKNMTDLLDTNITSESMKNKITNVDLDEYLKSKPVIKG